MFGHGPELLKKTDPAARRPLGSLRAHPTGSCVRGRLDLAAQSRRLRDPAIPPFCSA